MQARATRKTLIHLEGSAMKDLVAVSSDDGFRTVLQAQLPLRYGKK